MSKEEKKETVEENVAEQEEKEVVVNEKPKVASAELAKVIESETKKIESLKESKGNLNEELIKSVTEESKKVDEEMAEKGVKMEAEASLFGLTAREMQEHEASVREFNRANPVPDDDDDDDDEPLETDPRGFLDRVLGKFSSRKLIVWTAATLGLFYAKIPADQWVTISVVYIGSQSAVDIFKVLKGVK